MSFDALPVDLFQILTSPGSAIGTSSRFSAEWTISGAPHPPKVTFFGASMEQIARIAIWLRHDP